ncbi:hypothetical protein C2E23DRAFT_360239 [Lenzites betulinus]|nr:hypothetical protein C2E23DRAFT_360239 [Lenzites betulinus]
MCSSHAFPPQLLSLPLALAHLDACSHLPIARGSKFLIFYLLTKLACFRDAVDPVSTEHSARTQASITAPLLSPVTVATAAAGPATKDSGRCTHWKAYIRQEH